MGTQQPDISGGRGPYKISKSNIRLSGKDWFYRIEGVQIGMVAAPVQSSVSVTNPLHDVIWRQNFPTDGYECYYLNGEVLSATGFENSSLSISLTDEKDSTNSVVTPSVQPGKDGARRYGFSFAMDFKIANGEQLPNAFVQCVSFDYWNNRRIEGYGIIHLPQHVGTHVLTVPCWRPVQGLQQELRRFFLGGSCELISPHASVGYNKLLKRITRLGLQAQSVGQVKLRVRVIKQNAGPIIPREFVTEPLDSNAPIAKNVTVFERFSKARAKMIELRTRIPGAASSQQFN